MAGLTNQEIMRIVNRFIGVNGGYLGNFSYRTHADFYPEYCDLDIDPYQYQGTTRERFISIIKACSPIEQALIIRGVLQKFEVGDEYAPRTRTEMLSDELLKIAERLENQSVIDTPKLTITSEVVNRALSDVEKLIQTGEPVSCVDRVHTALHGYLRTVCEAEDISYTKSDSMAKLFKLLRKQHPALTNLGTKDSEIEKILNSLANILDAMNPIRNDASVAHPNTVLLENEEATLFVNVVRTLLNYLDAKITPSTTHEKLITSEDEVIW